MKTNSPKLIRYSSIAGAGLFALGALAQTSSVSPVLGDSSKLKDFAENQTTQKFKGKPISLQVRDAEVADVLRLIGEASGFNVVIGDDVKGKVTLALTDVPWDQALDL